MKVRAWISSAVGLFCHDPSERRDRRHTASIAAREHTACKVLLAAPQMAWKRSRATSWSNPTSLSPLQIKWPGSLQIVGIGLAIRDTPAAGFKRRGQARLYPAVRSKDRVLMDKLEHDVGLSVDSVA